MLDDLTAAGLRRTTPAGRRASALADGYAGLPQGVTRWRLAAALRAAATTMGLTGPMLRLLEHYIDLTYDRDWDADSEPVVTRPLVEIADHLGRSERQVRNIERALVEKGLLAWRDSGNHHRKGRRDRHTGKLVYAYGPSLAPLGAQATEILARAQAARAEITAARRLRIAISALRRRIRTMLTAATEAGVAIDDLIQRFDTTPGRHPAGLSLEALSGRRDVLIAIAFDADARLPDCKTVTTHDAAVSADQSPWNIACLPEKTFRHKTDTSNKHSMNGYRIVKGNTKPTPVREPEASDHTNGAAHVPFQLAWHAAGPELKAAAMRRGGMNWPTLIDAAHETALMLGINRDLWGKACNRLGRSGASLAILIIERGAARNHDKTAPIRQPDAYLQGMLARAEEGALHLDRSVRAWAQRRAE